MAEQGFKIVQLVAENFKKLKAIRITPNGSTVLLTGKNGAGKSSVLDAIMSALCGKKYSPDKPVRDGEKAARIVVDMGKFKAIRTFTATGGGTLKVESADGFTAGSPQKMLDAIVGDIAFDPMEFIRLGTTAAGKKEQRAILMKMAGLDFTDLDNKIEDVKVNRSIVNSTKTRLSVELAKLTFTDGLPIQEIALSDLTDKLNEATATNTAIAKTKMEYMRLNGEVLRQQDHIKSINDRIDTIQKQLDEYKRVLAQEIEKLAELVTQRDYNTASPGPIDIVPIQNDMAAVETKNKQIRQNLEYLSVKDKREAASQQFSELGKQAEALEAEKNKRLAEAHFPIEGLSVDEDGVTYNGIPLSQVNSAKQLVIGVAVSMKLNPKLRVLRMNGNDLDSQSLAVIEKMVEANGYQAWIEKVAEDGKVGFYIEDGEVVETEDVGGSSSNTTDEEPDLFAAS